MCYPDQFRIFAHPFIDQTDQIVSQPFPYSFDWITHQIGNPLVIAIHIRRGDVSMTNNSQRYIPIEWYVDCLQQLTSILHQSGHAYQVQVYSQNLSSNESHQLQYATSTSTGIVWKMDCNVIETFKALVNADVLIAGFSSLSYSASFLRHKGLVIHPKYWHQYSNHSIEFSGQLSEKMINQRLFDCNDTKN